LTRDTAELIQQLIDESNRIDAAFKLLSGSVAGA
jgi:hypothetical protein